MPNNARGGSPRVYRAWPLAWPSPSGPLGRQRLRRSRVGPEDRFCEAVRNNHAPLRGAAVGYENWVPRAHQNPVFVSNDLRVPLTLEGPTRTMRGVPARWL